MRKYWRFHFRKFSRHTFPLKSVKRTSFSQSRDHCEKRSKMSTNKRALGVLLACYIAKQHRERRKRTIYARDIYLNRNVHGETFLVRELSEDQALHHKYFRMNKVSFDIILDKIADRLFHVPTHARPINPMQRLAITLRYLASGSTQMSLGFNFRVSAASVCKIIREVMNAICDTMEGDFLKEPEKEDWKLIAEEFQLKWSFPMCVGAIDGKHVRIKAPAHSGSQYRNYKGYFSIVLLAVIDAGYRFRLVDIGMSGSNSDGGILLKSEMGKKFEAGQYEFPDPMTLATGAVVPAVIVGDDAFPLKTYMLKPYSDKSYDYNVFNYRLSRARMVSENGFGILSARCRILHSLVETEPELATLATKTAVIIHNFLMTSGDFSNITADTIRGSEVIAGNWRGMEVGSPHVTPLSRQGSNNFSTDAFVIRDHFKNFFLSEEGQLPWQRDYVLRGYL